jgi:hypothetical protein
VVCNRAAAAAKLGRHEDALADAELAIELDSSYAKAYVRRAQVRVYSPRCTVLSLIHALLQAAACSWVGCSKFIKLRLVQYRTL